MNWGSVVSGAEFAALRKECDQRTKGERFFYRAWAVSFAAFAVAGALALGFAQELQRCSAENAVLDATAFTAARKSVFIANALNSLSETHSSLVNASVKIESFGRESWGRRFAVTKYVPSAGGINADSDREHTATMWKARPRNRIVAVDPEVIPYGSWVWIEGLGWFNAQDCGGAIKGFRLDVLSGNLREAFKYGKQDRFVIVVPKEIV